MKNLLRALCLASALTPWTALAEEYLGTLTLDGLSFLSFEHIENLAIPSGSTIRFRFSSASGTGSISFAIHPADVSISSIPLPGGQGELIYTLAQTANGTISKSGKGYEISFPAVVGVARASDPEGGGSHLLGFTTQHAQSTSIQTGETVHIDGMPVVPAPRYVQLAGAVTNPADAEPHPGRAVVTILSGSFDWLPDLQ